MNKMNFFTVTLWVPNTSAPISLTFAATNVADAKAQAAALGTVLD
jgi:hypothetical protein